MQQSPSPIVVSPAPEEGEGESAAPAKVALLAGPWASPRNGIAEPGRIGRLNVSPGSLSDETDKTSPDRPDGAARAPARGYRFSTFTHQVGRVKWEVLGAVLLISATRVPRVARHGRSFHGGREGWFGKNTYSLGMDKMHHAWKTYVLTDLLQSAIEQRTGDRKGAAITSGILGLGLMTYGEIYDGFSHSGYSHEDEVVHFAGAGFSVLRNMVPGMREKVDFRMMWAPPARGHDRFNLRNQLAHRKYLFAVQLAGFKKWERSPLRFVELHFGYYARGFTAREQAEGHRLRRRLYFGVGFNVQALFARHPQKRVEQIAKGAFDYIQLPYTAVEVVH